LWSNVTYESQNCNLTKQNINPIAVSQKAVT
jgi:hypothetical protein